MADDESWTKKKEKKKKIKKIEKDDERFLKGKKETGINQPNQGGVSRGGDEQRRREGRNNQSTNHQCSVYVCVEFEFISLLSDNVHQPLNSLLRRTSRLSHSPVIPC
jgi:hypothetical protein